MSKRGQFTLFVVLGILVLLLATLFFVFKDDLFGFVGIGGELSYPSEIQEVVDHVQECVDASSADAVFQIGLSGGYYDLPEKTYTDDTFAYPIPYYLYDGEDLSLSSDDLEHELNDYISVLVRSCITLEQFSDFTITEGAFSAQSFIEDTFVEAEISYPLTVAVGENSYTLPETYETDVIVNLGLLRSVAQEIVRADIADPQSIDYTSLLGYGLTKITVAPVSDDTYVYVLQDGSVINYTFFFAEYYSNLVSDAECVLDLDCENDFSCVEESCVEEEE